LRGPPADRAAVLLPADVLRRGRGVRGRDRRPLRRARRRAVPAAALDQSPRVRRQAHPPRPTRPLLRLLALVDAEAPRLQAHPPRVRGAVAAPPPRGAAELLPGAEPRPPQPARRGGHVAARP